MSNYTTIVMNYGITEKINHYDNKHEIEVTIWNDGLQLDIKKRNFLGNVSFHKVYNHLREVTIYKNGQCISHKHFKEPVVKTVSSKTDLT